MKYGTSIELHNLELHDSPISNIQTKIGWVSVYLEFANILAEHSENPYGIDKVIEPCVLTFHGVTQNKALVFDDEKQKFKEHQYPQYALDSEILEVTVTKIEQDLSCYSLKGFHSTGWTEWQITAASFELSWDNFSKNE